MFRMVLAEARSLIRQRDQIEELAHAMLAHHADYQRLCTIPGIGPIHALTILAEAGDLRRFGHHRQFLKFCGLDLATCKSGTFRGRTKLSKYGNARLRRALWMAAQVAARQRDNSFRDKLGRYTERDRHDADLRRKAVTALTAKMARVVHAVIKGGAEYRPFFERPVPGGRTSLSVRAVRARKRPCRSCLGLPPGVYLVLRTVRTTAMSAGSCVGYGREQSR
jgi:Transposase IS116/IS110/IS902 family